IDKVILQLLAKSGDDRPFNARQVQAMMMEAARDYNSAAHTESSPTDHVFQAGRNELVRRIRARVDPQLNQVSGKRLMIAIAVIAGIIIALVAISAQTNT
ncbi:MAG: hypothetical protein KDB00_30285, partial [Planctomycetales bacterium]|nr:hypothetical protein [Planctomycetales bacterium]